MIDEYIRKHGKRLYGLCLTLCSSRFEADDLYQETWLKAFEHIDKYDTGREFEPWITRICVNTYRSTLRRISKSPLFDRFQSTKEKDDIICGVPEAPLKGKNEYDDLYKAVDALPIKLRLAVILFYFQDNDIASAARILGVPEGTVKSRLNKSRAKLREVLKNEEDI